MSRSSSRSLSVRASHSPKARPVLGPTTCTKSPKARRAGRCEPARTHGRSSTAGSSSGALIARRSTSSWRGRTSQCESSFRSEQATHPVPSPTPPSRKRSGLTIARAPLTTAHGSTFAWRRGTVDKASQRTAARSFLTEPRTQRLSRPRYDWRVSRLVFCARCDTDLGVLFEREADYGGTSVDYRPHGDCWHLSHEEVVDDLDALFSGESSLPVKLRREGSAQGVWVKRRRDWAPEARTAPRAGRRAT